MPTSVSSHRPIEAPRHRVWPWPLSTSGCTSAAPWRRPCADTACKSGRRRLGAVGEPPLAQLWSPKWGVRWPPLGGGRARGAVAQMIREHAPPHPAEAHTPRMWNTGPARAGRAPICACLRALPPLQTMPRRLRCTNATPTMPSGSCSGSVASTSRSGRSPACGTI